jgi:hypothetical protein
MKKLIFLASAAALAVTGPAVAKPGKGHGNKHAYGQQDHGRGSQFGYGMGGCPPGLAKKNNGCLPPGQAKKRFNVGQRVPYDYRDMIGYNALPYDVRYQYGRQLDPYGRYIYDNDYLYRVDPKTMIVQQILNAVLRPY